MVGRLMEDCILDGGQTDGGLYIGWWAGRLMEDCILDGGQTDGGLYIGWWAD